jgi:hypothetical protein
VTYTHDGNRAQSNREKQEVFRTLYGIDSSLFVHLDARKSGVVVPDRYKQSYQLVLQFGRDLPIPIEDLSFHEDRLEATLTFDQRPFSCTIPWQSIFFMIGETRPKEGFAWPKDCPGEILQKVHNANMQEAQEEGLVKKREDDSAKRARRRASFLVLNGSREKPSEDKPEKREPPTLRLVEPEENGEK